MSSFKFLPRKSSYGVIYQGWVEKNGGPWSNYTVSNSAEMMIYNPIKFLSGGKVINDSIIISGIINKSTDSLYIIRAIFDSLGVVTGGLGGGSPVDTVFGSGSRTAFRNSTPYGVADTSNYVSGYHVGWDIHSDVALTDSIFITGVEFKYHTTP